MCTHTEGKIKGREGFSVDGCIIVSADTVDSASMVYDNDSMTIPIVLGDITDWVAICVFTSAIQSSTKQKRELWRDPEYDFFLDSKL